MNIANCTNTPNFEAKLVARAITPKSEFQILEIDKIADAGALKKLNNSFNRENILQRFPDNQLLSATLAFINRAFESINNPNTKSYITLIEGKPSALMTLETSNPAQYIHLDYLAAWKPEGVQKPCYNGKVLIRHLFENAIVNKTKNIDLTPGFKSDEFYEKLWFEKLGFDFFISHNKIVESTEKIDETLKYETLEVQPQVDLIV